MMYNIQKMQSSGVKQLKKSNKYKATLILIIVTIGFLISSLFTGTFAGKLLTALFGASMIGGIADWFGITALFRKPLGIPFKTEILQHSRDRILESLVKAVEDELLTKEALIAKLEKLDISGKLIYYLDEQDGKKELTTLANKIIYDLFETIDSDKAGEYIGKVIAESADNLKAYPLFLNAVEWLAGNWKNEKVISELADDFKDFVLYPKTEVLIGNAIDNIFKQLQESSDKESAGKRLLFKLMFTVASFTDMSPAKLTSKLQTEALEYLNNIRDPESEQREKLEKLIEKNICDIKNNTSLEEKIESKSTGLLKQASLGQLLTEYLFPYIRNAGQFRKLEQFTESIVDKLIEGFRQSTEDQARLNSYIKNVLVQAINEYHGEIGKLVRAKLNMFSNEMLVEMIEDKAGNDLQIIRINGSVVGGIVGMLLFLMTFWIK